MFFGSSTFRPDEDIPDLSGQVIIVTGGNAGLGYETIRQLAKHNPARIYLAARSKEKATAAIQKLKESDPQASPIYFLHLDLSSFESVKAAVQEFKSRETRLDILMNNAGTMMVPEGLTKEGYEIQFGTNVMGPALLTQLLLPVLEKTVHVNPQARVVDLSSASEQMAPKNIYDFDRLKSTWGDVHTTMRYCTSKIADIHYTSALAQHTPVKVISVHPGMVATNLHHESTGIFLRPFLYIASYLFATPVEKGALSQIWAAVSPDAKSGEFYSPVGVPGKGSKASQDHQLENQLWDWIQKELADYL